MTEPEAPPAAPAPPVRSTETGPTAPTAGAMLGTVAGLYLAHLASADPYVQGLIVTASSALLALGTHLLFARLGIADPFA
jgi:hypothetical protein